MFAGDVDKHTTLAVGVDFFGGYSIFGIDVPGLSFISSGSRS